MNLHLNKNLFRDAIRITAQQMNIQPEFIEKDYWVTYALYVIFNHEIGNDTVFKGGTALSKCYKMIDRFSEDIDLVVLRREGETDNKLKTKIKAIGNVVSEVLPEVVITTITHKMGMNRKTAHTYSKEFDGNYGQVRDVIILESTWLGYYEPYTTRTLNSFIGEMMVNNGQTAIAEANGLMSFEVRVLEPIRTLCEKIMSLVRFSYSENPMEDLKNKIRHTYDLHQLLQQKEFSDFLDSPAFDEMIIRVATEDVTSFRNNNQWLANHPHDAFMFSHLDTIWKELKETYNGGFKNLVYGDLPNEEAVLETLKRIKERLKTVEWTVRV
ncbi:nucleotidyl transferase AbiEii/AbiGii toxin family protein [uncultured Flavobacterium sp.]|uniref:nucleotidyl transferase AbiEii/AbiGii toxin family protein n=1 Tax=uncultured Flavobacterium sp. TaxID=165435 RepID=UPI0025E2F1B2|nr:nucleotidyl transferase AbiEii/AbiGii toxin family protein [uncultured Flavobacterium sp.]